MPGSLAGKLSNQEAMDLSYTQDTRAHEGHVKVMKVPIFFEEILVRVF